MRSGLFTELPNPGHDMAGYITKSSGISMVTKFKVYEDSHHLKISEVQQTLDVTILEPNTTNFELTRPTAVFVLDSAVICTNDKVVEIEQSYYHGDKYKFAVIANPETQPKASMTAESETM